MGPGILSQTTYLLSGLLNHIKKIQVYAISRKENIKFHNQTYTVFVLGFEFFIIHQITKKAAWRSMAGIIKKFIRYNTTSQRCDYSDKLQQH
jgi:hypothetical protein